MVPNYCDLCTTPIEPDKIYCKNCSVMNNIDEQEEQKFKKRKIGLLFSKLLSIRRWVIVLLLIVLLLFVGLILFIWISNRSHENVIFRHLNESHDGMIKNVSASSYSGNYSVKVYLCEDSIQLTELENIFLRITGRVDRLSYYESLNIREFSIIVDFDSTNESMEGLLPIRRILWRTHLWDVFVLSHPGFDGDLSIDMIDGSYKRWRTSAGSVSNIIEAVAISDTLDREIHTLLGNIVENPYVKTLETKWLWDYYDYYNDLSMLSVRHTDHGRRNFSARSMTWPIHIFIEFDSSVMPIEDFQEQVILINTQIVEQLKEMRIYPYNLSFRYEMDNESASVKAFQWTFPYYLFDPGSQGDLLFLGDPLDRLNQRNLPVDKIQQMINFSMELNDSSE